MAPEVQKPANPDQSNNPEKKLNAPVVQPAQPETPEDKSFNEKVDQKAKQYEEKVEKLRERFRSQGSIGAGKADVLTANQINRLRLKATEQKNQFRALAADMKAQRQAIMLEQTDQELQKLYFPYEKIIDYARRMDKIDDAALVKLDALMKSMIELKTNPELEKYFYKALNQEAFTNEDYLKLTNLISPIDLDKEINSGKAERIFENSQIGAVVSVMSPSQRFELCQTIVQTLPPARSAQILESFTTTRILSNTQLKALCDSGKISEPYKTQLLQQIDGGQMAKKQQEYQTKLRTIEEVNKGRTAEHAINKTMGAPLAFGLSAMWGALVMLVNFKADFRMPDLKTAAQTAATAVTSEGFLIGAAATGIGTAGILNVIAPEKFDKAKDTVVDFFSGPEAKKEKSAANEQRIHEYLETPFKTNPYLSQFFTTVEEFPDGRKKNGFQVVREMVEQMQLKNQPVNFDLQEILKNAGPKQKEFLTKALSLENGQQPVLIDKLRTVMSGCAYLKVTTAQDFDKLMAQINKKQGLQTP